MRLTYQFAAFLILGIGAFYAGIVNFISPNDALAEFSSLTLNNIDSQLRFALEAQIRLLASMWMIGGLAIIICINHFERHAAVFSLVTVGLAASSLSGIITAISLEEPVTQEALRAIFPIILCVGLEFWRRNLTKKANLEEPEPEEA